MDQAELNSLIPPKPQNPLLIRKPLNLGTSFQNYKDSLNPLEFKDPLNHHSVTLLLFGASWCNITKPFVERLKAYYEQINLEQKRMEIILVSIDKAANEYEAFTSKMPWIGISYFDERVNDLKEFYNVRSVPSLLLIDRKGELVSQDCRQDVYNLGQDQAYDKWKKLKQEQQTHYY